MTTGRLMERLGAILLALVFWQLAAISVGQSLLLVSPLAVIVRLTTLVWEPDFLSAVLFSLLRILGGWALALAAGSLLAVAAGYARWVESLLWPYMTAIKSVPIASFIILCLIWLDASNLSVVISFLMVLPIVYTNLVQGIRSTDAQLLEMASLFRIGWLRRLRCIHLPHLKPHVLSAASVTIGLAWKSGIAAEVIGIPEGSIGERLYEAKVFFSTGDLFAWTLVIVLASVLFEKLFMRLIRLAYKGIEHSAAGNANNIACAGASLRSLRIENDSREGHRKDLQDDLWKDFHELSTEENSVALVFSHVSRHYGDKPVLEDVNASFAPGSVTCIMGPSGGGKTTLLSLALGLSNPDSGLVTGLPKEKSAVFQEDRLCEAFSAVMNVRIVCGSTADVKEIRRHLSRLKLDDSMDKPVRQLSGGMRRRVAIVRAMLAPSRLVVLDEPFKGLDAALREVVIRYVKDEIQGRTLLLVTHESEDAKAFGGDMLLVGVGICPATSDESSKK